MFTLLVMVFSLPIIQFISKTVDHQNDATISEKPKRKQQPRRHCQIYLVIKICSRGLFSRVFRVEIVKKAQWTDINCTFWNEAEILRK